LNAVLAMGETEDAVKVISSPKLVVLNKESATVTESTPVGLPVQSVSNGVVTNTIQITQANITLKVTPTVTNDSGVQLDLSMDRGVPFNLSGGGQAVADRNMSTKVLVESGSTLVIGGVYTLQTDHSTSGFPFLRNIPILGFLFGNESTTTQRSELFFFVTPRILNPKEAGLAG
jgi:type II secretory pathway component HofQ